MKKILITFALFTLSFQALQAQTVMLPAVYAEAPDYRPDNQLQYLNAMAEMEKLNAGQLTALAEQLKPYGSSSNTPFQYALNGYAGYVMKPGREALRKTAVQAFGHALNEVDDNMNKQFLIRQLQLIGTSDAVSFLKPCLSDSFLSRSAAQALATIATADAKKALREALQSGTPATRVPLVQALGDCRDENAVQLIAPFAESNDPLLKKTALYALAAIGDPKSAKILYDADKKQPKPNTLSQAEQAAGFQLLFNGKNLDGWTGNTEGYRVENGAIAVHPGSGSGGNLYTEEEFGDFVFRFQFKLTPGANNGIGIRAPLKGNAAYQGMEIQVLDNTADKFNNLHLYQYHGSVYGVIPAKRGYLNPVGQWNDEEIRMNGTKIKVTLNGHVIVDGDIAPSIANGTMDHKDHPGLKNKKGHIGFLGHGSVVWFRNLRARELP